MLVHVAYLARSYVEWIDYLPLSDRQGERQGRLIAVGVNALLLTECVIEERCCC